MKLTIPQLDALMQKLEAQPNLTSTTPGPKCRECGLAFIVVRGRQTQKWHIFHQGGPDGRACQRYRDVHPQHETQEAAVAHAETL